MGLRTLVGAVNEQREQAKKRIMNTLEGSRVGRAILFTGRAIDSTMRVASLGIGPGMRFALGVMGNLTSWLTQTSDYSKNGIYPKAGLKGKKGEDKNNPHVRGENGGEPSTATKTPDLSDIDSAFIALVKAREQQARNQELTKTDLTLGA